MNQETKMHEETQKQILDSGNRRQFASGAVRDISDDKGRMDLLPIDTVAALADYYASIDENTYVSFTSSFLFKCINDFIINSNEDALYYLLSTFIYNKFKSFENAMIEVSILYQQGCIKYKARNWQMQIPTHSFLDSAMRHCCKLLRGDQDERHDRAFIWNILGLLWTRKHYPEADDIYYGDKFSPELIKEYHEKWGDK